MNNGDRIVNRGLKFDLHIHSCHSLHRESNGLTANNTISNIPNLVKALKKHEVDIVAITDHDVFSYNMYKSLKQYEDNGTFKKVFPGVEFTLMFKDENGNDSMVHAVTIFDDSDDKKIQMIEEVLSNGFDKNGNPQSPDYDVKKTGYSEKEYFNKLNKIGLDVVIIAHQKNSIFSKFKQEPPDAYALGEKEFNRLMYSGYFQALEFHSRNNEIYNNVASKYYSEDLLRFITGSDCHDWDNYPLHDINEKDKDEFLHTYMKCLPTFRGLAMALTDLSRINLTGSFFHEDSNYQKDIVLYNKSNKVEIPLSKGINVIIGDNSIGKSLLLHKITGYYRSEYQAKTSSIDAKLSKSYDSYLEKKGIEIETRISPEKIYEFDSQGEVRKKFAQNEIDRTSFISKRTIDNLDVPVCKENLIVEVKKYLEKLKLIAGNAKIIEELNNSILNLNESKREAESIKYIKYEQNPFLNSINVNKQAYLDMQKAINSLESIKKYLQDDEKKNIDSTVELLKKVYLRYKNNEEMAIEKNSIINMINLCFDEVDSKKELNSDDKILQKYFNGKEKLINIVSNRVCKIDKDALFELPSIKEFEIPVSKNECGNYKVIKATEIEKIDDKYFKDLFKKPLSTKLEEKVFKSNISLESAIKKRTDTIVDPWEDYENQIIEKINRDFKVNTFIAQKSDDDRSKYSSGMNERMYFDILSHDKNTSGIYMIDQPEDDVSQKSIHDYMMNYLREMSKNRQVIIITHNPQFVVNLDVDNIICLKENDGEIDFKYGALEYVDSNTDILNEVANTLDGGALTIRKRWKRYEKNIDDING